MDYLDQVIDNKLKIDKIFSEASSVVSIFRKLSELSRLLLIRSLNINSINQAIPIKLFNKWTTNNGSRVFIEEVQKYRIATINNNHDQLLFNQQFAYKFSSVQSQGVNINNTLVIQPYRLNQQQVDTIQKHCYQQWQNIHECIVGLHSKLNSKKLNKIVSILKVNGLLADNGSQAITKEGFEFILSSTSNQINRILLMYTNYMESKGYMREDLVNIVLLLNLQDIHIPFTLNTTHQLLNIIVQDLASIGLIHSLQHSHYVLTKLLTNFSFQKLNVNMKFKFNVIIETNFKIYVYSNNDFIVRLLENFCQIEYKMPGFIVGEMKRENVMRLFRNNIKSEQLIEFLSQNIDLDKLKHINNNNTNNHLYNQTTRGELEFLQIYKRTQDNHGIPDNVCQQLHLWHSEIGVNFSRKALEDEKQTWEQELAIDQQDNDDDDIQE